MVLNKCSTKSHKREDRSHILVLPRPCHICCQERGHWHCFLCIPRQEPAANQNTNNCKNTFFPRCTINTHLCINCASRISLFYLMPHFSISNYPCVWVIFDAAKPFVYEIPIVKLVPLRLLIFIQNASFEDRTCVLLDIINTSDGQLFLTRRAPALRARLYITPKSISYTHTNTDTDTHKHTQRNT